MPRALALPAFLALLLAPALAAAQAGAPRLTAPPIAFHQRILANGLRLITSVDKTTPNVTVQVWYGVGAKNDPAGRSGFAHLFEHLMFKATRDMPAENMDRLTEDVGGMNNAFTADDTTAYYEVIPANYLQRLLWAESERMTTLVVDEANFKSERAVVEEELRQRVLASPYGRFFNLDIPADSFAVHPYRRAPIGSIAELEAAGLDDVRAFHATFYRPDDAALIVIGNFDQGELDAWVDKYFGAVARPATAIPTVTAVEPPRTGARTFTEYGPNVPLPAVAITWLAPAARDADAPALEVLDALLTTGKSSRLYNHLIYKSQLAAEVFSSADLRAQPGLFYVGAVMAGGRTVEDGERALRAEVADLRDTPVSGGELDIAKNQLLAAAVRRRETVDGRANELGQALVEEGDPARANTDLAALGAVTAADVQRVARKYLADDTRVVIRYLAQTARPAGAAAVPAPPPPTPSVPYTGPVASLAPEGQRQAPPPVGAPVAAVFPVPAETTLANGLRVIVAKSSELPLLAAELTILGGAQTDPPHLAGDASLAADLVTEGTATRTAPQIARQTEALGATLSADSGWESSQVSLSVLTNEAAPALAIMADVAEHPAFAPAELERVRKESLDALTVALQKPGDIARFVTSPVVFAGTPFGHVEGGDPASLVRLRREDLTLLHDAWWRPDNAILVITGNLAPDQGFALAREAFGGWAKPAGPLPARPPVSPHAPPRAIAVDLPGTGQAAVVVAGSAISRADPRYYTAVVANAVLGGGYSARLNEEIRVKRGLSYGAGSRLEARSTTGVFTAQAQTKNESAPQVVALMRAQIAGLADAPAAAQELEARKSSLIGEFGRTLATADGLGGVLGELALHGVDPREIGLYTGKVEAVSAADAQAFAREALRPGAMSVVVVGDARAFAAPLAAALPGLQVIPIARLDLDSATLEAAAK
ncbi:MAG TPA: pitrilysin family protein [Caulobacteraceae bacterium]